MPSFVNMDKAPDTSQVGSVSTPKTKASRTKHINFSTQALRIGHQRVNIDVNLLDHKIEGFTELIVLPTSKSLKCIKLDCRELMIKDVYINDSRITNYIYKDTLYINDDKIFEGCIKQSTINLLDLYSNDFTIHQHHLLRQKLNYIFGENNYDPSDPPKEFNNGNTEELIIFLPDNLKIELTDISSIHTPGSYVGTATPLHLRSRNTTNEAYSPINVKIDYELRNPKNGINFMSNKSSERRTWHAYTTNSDYNISTSSWVPCIDNLWDRNTWSMEVNIPRTIKDIEKSNNNTIPNGPRAWNSFDAIDGQDEIDGIDKNVNDIQDDEKRNTEDDDEEDDDNENYDLTVCSGDFNNIKETPHPVDVSKKVVSWSIFNPICAHHVGWAVGCFQYLLLSTSEQAAEEELLKKEDLMDDLEMNGENASVVALYFLPGKEDLAKNTGILSNKAIDFFSKHFGSFPFSSFAIVFVDGCSSYANNFAGLSVLSDDILYPPDLIEPMFTNTEIVVEAIASQWSGINITPQTIGDTWCTIGIAHFMLLQFLKTLMGSNHCRFKVKEDMNKIMNVDIGKKPLAYQFFRFPISEDDLKFIKLKAPIVLFILDRRMTKTDKAFGLSRVISKLFLQAMSGDLQNSTLSTPHFEHVCEKVARIKLDSFFKQWVYSSGYPIFKVSQKFNRKRTLIEMSIRQTQHSETKRLHPDPNTFINDSIGFLDEEPSFPILPVFRGPMTIRIHEADGTPYEHIVDIKEGQVKIDIQYNSRLRRMRKHKDDTNDISTNFSKLGDVLEDQRDVQEWGFTEWSKEEEDSLNDGFEWIRVDADFEWIAQIHVKQPDYMYCSQLQYDRDVEAQYDAVKYFANIERPNTTYCTTLTRTLMDSRYYNGIRLAAAHALTQFSKPENNFIGIRYLIKAYKEMFCFPGSSIPYGNDFTDFPRFFLQKNIPAFLSEVREENGKYPTAIRELLLNLIKFNENHSNNFQDCFYISDLLKALTNCVIQSNDSLSYSSHEENNGSMNESKKFIGLALSEIDRLQKLDEWVPSYQNIVGITCLEQKIKLAARGLHQVSFEDLLYYTLDRYSVKIRIMAFKGLFLLGGLKNAAILQYFLKILLLDSDVSYFRRNLIRSLSYSLCVAAIEGTPSTLDDPEFKTFDKLLVDSSRLAHNQTNMVIIEDAPNTELTSKRDNFTRATISGAIKLLRRDYAIGKGLKAVFWELLHTSLLSVNERREIFCICEVLYEEVDSFLVRVPIPSVPLSELKRKIVLKNLGDGKLMFRREGRFKLHVSRKLTMTTNENRSVERSNKSVSAPLTSDSAKLKLKLDFSNKKAKKVKSQPADSNLVTIDPTNSNLVTIKLRLGDLDFGPLRHSDPPLSLVTVRGSSISVKFTAKYIEYLKNLAPKSEAVRYVKILTRRKKVILSATPFDSIKTTDVIPSSSHGSPPNESSDKKEPKKPEETVAFQDEKIEDDTPQDRMNADSSTKKEDQESKHKIATEGVQISPTTKPSPTTPIEDNSSLQEPEILIEDQSTSKQSQLSQKVSESAKVNEKAPKKTGLKLKLNIKH